MSATTVSNQTENYKSYSLADEEYWFNQLQDMTKKYFELKLENEKLEFEIDRLQCMSHVQQIIADFCS
jgi:hypothetical protein